MHIWALSDLHLSLGTPHKAMDIFGWHQHHLLMAEHWDDIVDNDDIVLIPGDFSWATHSHEVLPDIAWLAQRPGIKVMIKGNHDYWWGSLAKAQALMPPSVHLLQHSALAIQGVAIAGTRFGDSPEFSFRDYSIYQGEGAQSTATYDKEIHRLELALQGLQPASITIAMTHYPPISADLQPSRASQLYSHYHVTHAVFGHLHALKPLPMFGTKEGISYLLTSCDRIQFTPLLIASI